MTTEKIKSATEVLSDFLAEQAGNEELDTCTVSAICDLHSEGKLTKTSLLRRLDDARKDAAEEDRVTSEDSNDD